MFGRAANGGGRPVCKFFLEGRCKFGDGCKNEHPKSQPPQQPSNRFAPLQNSGNTGFRGRAGGARDDQTTNMFSVNEDAIRDDLTTGKERPTWPLSAYGPGVKPPRQLLEGPVEVSPEEMRVLCYIAQAAGNPQEYVQHEGNMLQQVDQQISKILGDLPGAKKYVVDGQHEHPNRNDTVNDSTPNFPRQSQSTQTAPAFGTNTTGFGAPSNLGAPKPAFGTSPSPAPNSAFGAPSSLGAASGFGNPSTLGGGAGPLARPSPFGQPSSLGQNNSAFGGNQQPAPFGQAAKPSPFGQPSAMGQTSAFGQPSAFGAATNRPSPFAQAAASKPSPFAQAGTNPNSNQSPFGQTVSNNTTNNSPFAQASQTQAQPSNPFAKAAIATPAVQAPSGFGPAPNNTQNTGFGAQATNPNPFGSNNPPNQGFGNTTSGFGQTTAIGGAARAPNNFSGQQQRSVAEDGLTYIFTPAPTKEDPNAVRRERVWFPDGPPPGSAENLDAQGPAEAYTGEIGKTLEEIYAVSRETGNFTAAGGIVPEIPPKREWISWDF